MKNTIRTAVAASAATLAAAAVLGGAALGAGTATAGKPAPINGHAVGPYPTISDCRDGFGSPMLPKTDCFYNVSSDPHNSGWYFIGGIGA